ncbi:Methyl-CpG-binding domain-containing protein 13 [Bienertia sinuspersici]
MCYINSKNHKKFYSKAAVLRYIHECTSNEQLQPVSEDTKKSSGKTEMHLVEANEPEWLPKDWIMERRTRKSGAKAGTEYKCYIDPSTGTKFFSKPEVLRYIGSKKSSAASSRQKDRGNSGHSYSKRPVDPPSVIKSSVETNVSQLSKTCVWKNLSSGRLKIVTEKTVDQELPSGWIKVTRIKMRGNEVVRRDSSFNDPASPLVFRSKLEVLRYVETGEISRHAYRRRTGSITGKDYAIGKTPTTSSGKGEETQKRRTRKQLFVGEASMEQSVQALPETQGNENAADKKSKRSSSSIGSAPSGAPSSVQSYMSPESTKHSQDMVVAKPLLEKVSGTNKSARTIKHTQPEVQDAGAKHLNVRKSERSALSRGILSEGSPVAAAVQRCTDGKGQASKRKTSHGKLPGVPSRSSKRLAGVDVELVFHPIPIEHACRAIRRKSSDNQSFSSLAPVPNELQEKHQTVDTKDCNEPALQATCRKTSRTKPVPSSASVPSESQEKCRDVDMQDVLAEEEKDCTPDVDTEFVFGTQVQPSNKMHDLTSQEEKCQTVDFDMESVVMSQAEPSNKIFDLTTEEARHRLLDVDGETVLASSGEPSNKVDGLTSPEEKRCTLAVDRENVLASRGESSNKIDDLRSEETKNHILDVNQDTVFATLGEPSNKLDDLTSREEKHCTLEVDGETVLVTRGEPSNKVDDLTSPEEKHCTLAVDRENVLAARGESSNKIDDLRSEEAKNHILDVDQETVFASLGEPSNKLDDLTSREEKHCTLDVDEETVLTTGEPSNKVDDLATKNPILVDLNFLHLEQAPPGFSIDSEVNSSLSTMKQSLEHPMSNVLGTKVENTSMMQPIIEERPGSAQREIEQPQSEFCFSSPLWSDPCLEFAYKTLTGAIPFDDNLAIQDYIQHQLRTTEENENDQSLPDACAPSNFKNNEAKMVSELAGDANFSSSNGFGSPEIKQVKDK